jgi:hypothetical protein
VSTSAPPGEPVKVIYVMGSGHSGSTILGVALGNCRGMFFAGELHEFLARSGMPVLGGLERTRFWAQVRERTPQAVPLYGPRVLRLLERSSAALRLSALPAARALRPRYRAATASIFAAIAELAPARYVIDSSHFPLRARQLQQTPGVELHLIFLVREPQPVVASITRLINQHEVARRRLMTLKTNADLWLTYALSLAVFRRQPPQRRMLVHFEDLIAAPEAVLAQILAHAGADPQLPDLEALRTGLAIHGNRFIQQELVAFKRSPSAGAPERRGSALTALAQRPWQAVFARLRPAASRVAGG